MQKAGVKDRQRSETMRGKGASKTLEIARLGEEAGSGEVHSDSIPHVNQAAVAEPAPTDV